MSERKLLPMMPRYEPETMDHSATKTFKQCPRKYFYRMVLGRVAPNGIWDAVFAWGSSFHKSLEVLYETDHSGKAMDAGQKLFKPPTHSKFMYQTKDRWLATFIELVKFYNDERAKGQIKVMAIEQPFKFQFPDGIVIGGRWDQLLEWNGRIWVRDWKTTSKEIQWFSQELDPNDQAMRYIYAASALQYGINEAGVPNRVVDGVLFTAIRNMKTVGPTIHPIPSQRTLTQVEQWVKDTLIVHEQMAKCRETDTWPMHEVSCNFCDYRTVCTQSSQAGMEVILKQAFLLSPWDHEKVDQERIKE